MDDVDGAQAQLARTMLQTGDWVTGKLDGVIFLDKAPLKYWITASLYAVFGVHDSVARLPTAIAAICLPVVVFAMLQWAGSMKTGFYAGMAVATSIGLYLFTRIVIPDVILTLVMAICLWSFLRVLEEPERSRRWSLVMFACLAASVLLKGLIGLVFPIGAFVIYGFITRKSWNREVWQRFHLLEGLLVFLIIAVPWHVAAILRNPPHFDFTLHAGPHFGYKFRGFFWFYFINDQLLRFLNERWPRDYNTVPRLWFWLYHLLWFFPWSFFLVAVRRSDFHLSTRMGKLRVLSLVWIGVVMLFFTFSTTQEYYSMPIYPALAVLIGSCIVSERRVLTPMARVAGIVCALACAACTTILVLVANLPAPGDISRALSRNESVYSLSLGHMTDLTIPAFAYLKLPLGLAAIAFAIGAVAPWIKKGAKQYVLFAAMLVCFFQAARLAMVTFDPYLSSGPMADALNRAPKGRLISNGSYYTFSALYFYTDYQSLMLNGRYDNLEYGSYAPGGAARFIEDDQFVALWREPARWYVATENEKLPKLESLVGRDHLYLLTQAGEKSIWSNQPLP